MRAMTEISLLNHFLLPILESNNDNILIFKHLWQSAIVSFWYNIYPIDRKRIPTREF